MKMLMIDHYDSFTYNLKALLELRGIQVDVIRNDEYISAEEYAALIFSPGPSNPDNAGSSRRYFREYRGLKPILGVCLGMQVIGAELGYKIRQAHKIMHGKSDKIRIVQDNSILLAGIPNRFSVIRYHSLVVDINDSLVYAKSTIDDEAMLIEDAKAGIFGIQFHPESILSEYGAEMLQNFKEFVQNGPLSVEN